jgi:hypothetical protein
MHHYRGIMLWNHAHALNVRVVLERSIAALDGMKSYVWLHVHTLNVRVDLERSVAALDGGWRARCGYTRTECLRWPREGQSLLWTEWRARCLYRAMSGSVRPDGRDVTRALCSQLASGLAGSRSLTFRWVELLDHTDCGASECPSLILCRLVERDPMQLGAAMLHIDWLDGRTLGDWHLG